MEPSGYERAVHEYGRARLGAVERVGRWLDERERGGVLIGEVADAPLRGMRTAFTIGLAALGAQVQGEDQELRVELLVAGRDGDRLAVTGLSNCALNLSLDGWETVPGSLHRGAFGVSATTLTTARHAMIWLPVHWQDDFEPLSADGLTAHFLEVLPITDEEMAYVQEHGDGPEGTGAEAVMRCLAEQGADTTDFTRPSVRLPAPRRRWFPRR